jgi:hypothetical protein
MPRLLINELQACAALAVILDPGCVQPQPVAFLLLK